jgi:hypothetical protein
MIRSLQLLQAHKAAAGGGQQSSTPSAVKVAVMVRPLLPFEQHKGGTSSVSVHPPNKVRVLSRVLQLTLLGAACSCCTEQ